MIVTKQTPQLGFAWLALAPLAQGFMTPRQGTITEVIKPVSMGIVAFLSVTIAAVYILKK